MAANPAAAAEQANEILKAVPGHPDALLIQGAARLALGDPAGALAVIEPLAAAYPKAAAVHYHLGTALAEAGRGDEAIAALRRTVKLNGQHAQAWRLLGDLLTATGDSEGADAAYARHIQASVNDPRLMEAAGALCDNKLAVAEHGLRAFLKENPTDVAAIRMLAEVASRLGRYEDAQKLLSRALELAPSFDAARANYATVLMRQNRTTEALAEIEALLKRDPRNTGYRAQRAAALARIGEYQQTIADYEAVLKAYPTQPKAWMSYGHALKTVGRTDDGIAAYRRSLALLPSLGESWWSLANLKTFRFTDEDVAAMRRQLARSDLSDDDRLHLDFALGKALEDGGAYEASFAHYDKANALRRKAMGYEAEDTTRHVDRSTALFTKEFFGARAAQGSAAPDPVFILGLTRSGSTLLEQILASHPAVEGTMELPDITALAKRIGGRKKKSDDSAYPENLATLAPEDLRALGEEYLERTAIQRKLGRPLFIDKMPSNWLHTGLIHLILPKAKIIDARRQPLACCFSNFKQHFARGQGFTYDLTDLGRYYYDYARLMAHFDAVLPGRVHRVIYEEMVADPEREVRRLLDYCGLPFEPACLRFYENERAVRTASSEQVRRPIYKESVEQWRHYEPWLDPLKAALGEVLENYPQVPADWRQR
ncbi:MAG: sulfotransferase [Alphaproteobacteria bacterium]|nr:sulfotransferase [Alphaproteobacteria bacterium]